MSASKRKRRANRKARQRARVERAHSRAVQQLDGTYMYNIYRGTAQRGTQEPISGHGYRSVNLDEITSTFLPSQYIRYLQTTLDHLLEADVNWRKDRYWPRDHVMGYLDTVLENWDSLKWSFE